MLVLLTRPRQQALATAKLLHGLGHRVIIEPMLALRHVPHETVTDASGIAAVLLTSANAVQGVDPALKGLPCFVVGAATARAARDAGCTDLRIASGEGAELAKMVAGAVTPAEGRLLHICGEEAKEDVGQILKAGGYEYAQLIVYRAEPAQRFSTRTITALREGDLGAGLFYSPRTAKIFAEMVQRDNLAEHLSAVTAACLSEPIASQLRGLSWKALRVAARRDQGALLDCLEDPA